MWISYIFSYSISNLLTQQHPTLQEPSASSSSYSPLLGAYVILGLFAAAFTSMVFALLTFLALHSQRCVCVCATESLGGQGAVHACMHARSSRQKGRTLIK